MNIDTEVLVVGYGPVGQTLAALLAAKGHRVDVYERFSCLYDLPRAVYFDDEIMQVWQSLGITGDLDLLPIKAYDWFGADGDAIFRMEHPGARPVGLGGRIPLLPADAGAGPRSARAVAAHRHRPLRLERRVARTDGRVRRGHVPARARAAHRRISSRPTRRGRCGPAT